MRTKTVVLFVGNAGHGKDASANFLCSLTGGVKMAYADPLKDAVHAMLGIPKDILYGTQEQKATYTAYGRTCRQWVQWLGTDVGRNMIDKNLWVHRYADRVLASPAEFVFCSDARYRNEIVDFRERLLLESVAGAVKVVTVRIINPSAAVDLSHTSESELYYLPKEMFDVILMNDGSLDDLHRKLKDFADVYLGTKVDDPVGHQV